ncbi:MAG TPA: rhodanese-like domain-containing protein [Burkholderiaceae bacterium]|jgi:rhodanese-related sulfurtransferase|nr:rhodanese-like domain-containing protein [Burkholderiaceae bacterium]
MDRISICELDEWRQAGRAFTLIDVRRAHVRAADGADIPGSLWLAPEKLFAWKDEVTRDRPAILVCAHGHELSQGAAATLRAMGLDARFLIDGFAGWRASGRPVVPIVAEPAP